MSSTTFRNIIQSAGRQLQKRVYWKYGVNVSAKNYLDDEAFKSVTLKYNTFPTDGTVCDYMELQLSIDITTSDNYDSTRPVYLEVFANAGGVQATETYGPYYLKENPSYDASSKTYTHKFYDEMIKTMIPYVPLSVTYPITLTNYFSALMTQLSLTTTITLSVTGSKTLSDDPYYGIDDDGNPASMGYTYRDVISDILQANGILGEIQAGTLSAVGFGQVAVDVDDDILKNVNIDIDKNFRVNCLTLTRANGTDNITYKNDSSISSYGKHELVIADNMILNDSDREDYIQALYNQWGNKNWNYCDLELTGFGGFDKLERVRIKTNGQNYFTYAFNNEITIDESYNEVLYVPEEQTTSDGSYSYTSTEEKTDKNAEIIINKKIGEVDIRGKAIKLTADDITIESNNFNVDTEGNLICTSAKVNGGSVDLYDTGGAGTSATSLLTIYSNKNINSLVLNETYFLNRISYFFIGTGVQRFSQNQTPADFIPVTILEFTTATRKIRYNYLNATGIEDFIEEIYDVNNNQLISSRSIRQLLYNWDTSEYYIYSTSTPTEINEEAVVTQYNNSTNYGSDVLSHLIYVIKNEGGRAELFSDGLAFIKDDDGDITEINLINHSGSGELFIRTGEEDNYQAVSIDQSQAVWYSYDSSEDYPVTKKIEIDSENNDIKVNNKSIIKKSNITMGLGSNVTLSNTSETKISLSRVAYTGQGLTATSDGGVLIGTGISAVTVSAQANISSISGNATRTFFIKRDRNGTLSNIARVTFRYHSTYSGTYNTMQIIPKISGVQEGDKIYLYAQQQNPSSGTSSTTIYGSNIDTYLTVQELE